jgi:hypothetical protein
MTLSTPSTTGSILVSACSMQLSVSVAEGADNHGGHFDTTATIDACDISGGGESGPTSGTAVDVSGEIALVTLTLTNSYVHDCEYGVSAASFAPGATHVILLNDTFDRAGRALYVEDAVDVFDDIIVNSGIGISLFTANNASEQHFGNNALFGNGTNYTDSAVDGPGYVKTDPKLDTSTPPGLRLASPCRGAGDPGHATAVDFWGAPRGAKPDIGAVQSP